jgi:hypothetical protein
VKKGEAKINSSTNFPHDIVHSYLAEVSIHSFSRSRPKVDDTLEQLWKALPDYGISDTLVVADGSGSMESTIPESNVSALEVANALAVYCAEHNQGVYQNKYITFSARPKFVDFSGAESLIEKLMIALEYNEVANTNIEATFDLILTTAVENKIPQNEMPRNVLIISDMEFDGATHTYGTRGVDETLFENIARDWENAGYKLPRLVFWNVNGRTNTVPIQENECGVALVSGFSVAIAKMVMSDVLDPWLCLKSVLDSPRYEKVKWEK